MSASPHLLDGLLVAKGLADDAERLSSPTSHTYEETGAADGEHAR